MPDREFKFDLDEVGPDAPPDDSIDPGSPELENVIFVLLGVLSTLFVIAQLAQIIP